MVAVPRRMLHALAAAAPTGCPGGRIPRRPRVLHITPEYFGPESVVGGGARYPLELARAMAELTPTRIVSFGGQRRSLRYGRARLEIYPQWPRRAGGQDPFGPGFLAALLRADVVHCYQRDFTVTVVAVLAAAWLRKPVFLSDLGGAATDLASVLHLGRHVCRFLDLSRFAAGWIGSGARSRLIYGGVDPVRFAPPAAPGPRDGFLYAGRLLPHKGIDTLIRAVGDDLPLTIAGKPYDDRYYHDLLGLAVGKPVRFRTGVDDAELRRLYQTSLAVVLPSVYTDLYGAQHPRSEYLGLTLLEGMACGAVPICSAVGGMPEIVEDGVTGFVVPPNDPAALRARLVQLRADPALRERLAAAALERVRRMYTWQQTATRCLAAYHDGPIVRP